MLKECLVFSIGATVGALVTRYLIIKKYEDQLYEQLSIMEDYYLETSSKEEVVSDGDTEIPEEYFERELSEEEVRDTYSEIVADLHYAVINEESSPKKVKGKPKNRSKKIIPPIIIAPEEFGEDEEYEKTSLAFYQDGVLCGINDEVIFEVDIEEMITKEALDHFGEFEEDSVFVRNDNLKTYFEILLNNSNYYDIKRPGNN